MFKSIYKKLKEDFDFLNEFGFFYKRDLKHYVVPSVVFSDGKRDIQVGMRYDEHKMYFTIYSHSGQLLGRDILEKVGLGGKDYKSQVNQVIEYIRSNWGNFGI